MGDMLEFFRKYQRSVMIAVAVVIIISFSFFGTYSALGSSEGKSDVVAGRLVDGSKLYDSEVRQLVAWLGKPEVFRRLVLDTGAGAAIAETEGLRGDWDARLAKARGAKFYVHPLRRELDARRVWEKLAPGLDGELEKLEGDFFAAWTKIYRMQEDVAPELVQRVLAYQLQQTGLPMDPRLVHGDFSLFGCKTVEDWFGRNFLELSAQFILNGAVLAKKEISREEARADFEKAFGVRGGDEVRLWGRVLGFLRACNEVGEAVLLEPLPFEKVSEFAREKAVLDVYKLPPELCLKDEKERIEFETYLRLVYEPAEGLPEKMLPLEKVPPELTAAVYRIWFGKLELASLGVSLSLKEVWDWQVDAVHWKELQKQFGWLKSAETADGRFSLLEKLEPASRRAVDAWSRTQMVFERPEWIESAFATAKVEEKEILVSKDWIDGIEIRAVQPFAELLAKGGEGLRSFQDGGALFRVEKVELVKTKRALSFAEAKGRVPVERFLEKEYRRIRGGAPSLFKSESGEWKKLSEVRETVLPMIFPKRDRLKGWMEGMLASLRVEESVEGLWSVVKEEQSKERNEGEWMSRDVFLYQPGEWSPVHVSPNGEITFFFVKERVVSSEPVLEQIEFAREALSAEAKRCFADRILEIAMKKKALACPLRIEEEKQG